MTRNQTRTIRRGFTLVEMLVVVVILGLLSGMVLVALAGAAETAREARTRTQITKLNEFIMTRYEGYRTRRTPRPTGTAADLVAFDKNSDGSLSAREIQGARVDNIRLLMQLEMPDRKTDLFAPYVANSYFPAIYARHQRAIMAFTGQSDWISARSAWSVENQSSECLYLILASINDGDTSALDFLHDSEIGDTDGDGVPEVLDGWGNPIVFVRWPQGFIGFESSLQDIRVFDSFDPLRTRTPVASNRPAPHPTDTSATPTTFSHFNLQPLVISAGKDGIFDVACDQIANAATAVGDYDRGTWIDLGGSGSVLTYPVPAANPYAFGSSPFVNADGAVGVGVMLDANNDGYDNSLDNISNHLLIVGGNSP